MAKKLTKAQAGVVDKMRNGWQLGVSIGVMNPKAWIQKGGCGKGGESMRVHWNTFEGLQGRGVIELEERVFPKATYRLTEQEDTAR